MANQDDLVKIHVDLPNHWATGGESMWAKPIADDLYRLENVPFYAYGLNYLDVVKAIPASEETIPEVLEVVKPSGRTTLRCIFNQNIGREGQAELLDNLKRFGAGYERATGRLVAIDVEADGSYSDVYDLLESWERDGILEFETCEQRTRGSFDAEEPEDTGAA